MLGSSPLSILEDLGDKKILKPLKEEAPSPVRAGTPIDLEYSHTGTLRIGSLVVTNGIPASPGPSLAETIRQSVILSLERKREEEYFTAEESGTELDSTTDKVDAAGLDINPQSKEIFDSDNTDNILESPSRHPSATKSKAPRPRSGSPLKKELRQVSNTSDEDNSPILSPLEHQTPTQLSTVVPTQSITLSELMKAGEEGDPASTEEPPRPFYHSRNDSTNSAESLASEYQKDLPDSPFSPLSPAADPNIIVPFGPLDLNESFEEDPSLVDDVEREVKSATPLSHHLFPVTPMENYLIPAYFDEDVTQKTALGSHPPVPAAIPVKSSSLKSRPSQTKSDSGYSSASAKAPEVDSSRSSWNNHSRQLLVEAPSNETEIVARSAANHEPHELEGIVPELQRATTSVEPSIELSPAPTLVHSQTMPAHPTRSELKPKSWRNSFMRLPISRLRSSESVSAQSIRSDSSDKGKDSEKEPKTPKKLQKKKRPTSTQVLSLDGTLSNEIPRIPSGILQRFDDRTIKPYGSTFETTYDVNERSEVPVKHELKDNGQPVQRKLSGRFRAFGNGRPSPVTATSFPVGPMDLNRQLPVSQPIQPQRRLSLKRLSRNLEKERDHSPRSQPSDDDEDDHHAYPHREYATFGSVAHSLGSSPYDLAAMATRASQHGPPPPPPHGMYGPSRAPPPPPQHGGQYGWNEPQMQHRPGPSVFRGRHRPKSFHGRGVRPRRMEVLGEEELEAELDGVTDLANGSPNSRSFPRPIGRMPNISGYPWPNPGFVEAERHPLPQFGGPPPSTSAPPATTDWAFHERTWRERREGLTAATASSPPSRPPPPPPTHRMSLQPYYISGSHDNNGFPESLRVGSGSMQQPQPAPQQQEQRHKRPHSYQPGRPGLTRNNSKSQPDLRTHRKEQAWGGYAEAERLSARPAEKGEIFMSKRRAGLTSVEA